MRQKIVAVGDVHGQIDLLDTVVNSFRNTNTELIFLGDLIDRAKERFGDRKVVTLPMKMVKRPEKYGYSKVTVLRGNHEQMIIDAYRRKDFALWEANGGSASFKDLVMSHPEIIDWMDNLPLYTIRGEYLFVHAGVRPGVPIKEQSKHDLLWIREPFLDEPHMLPYTIVHGHTFVNSEHAVFGKDRISIDTGACFTGNLCALPLSY